MIRTIKGIEFQQKEMKDIHTISYCDDKVILISCQGEMVEYSLEEFNEINNDNLIEIIYAYHNDMRNQAIRLGAKKLITYCIKEYVYGVGKIDKPFSYHFFNEDGKEICYYIHDLIGYVPMFIFKEYREWSEEFKNNDNYKSINL